MNDTLIHERYLLLEAIGTGGEAQVFRALDNATSRQVALRLDQQSRGETSLPEAPPELYPGWVRLLDQGIDATHGAYQVFEFFDGPTLSQAVRRSPLGREEWQQFVTQSLRAVEALHQAGWVHGDLNGDNFILAGDAQWKLIELPFHSPPPPADRTPAFGSIHTLAPEQLDGAPPDARSDYYSLGCLYYFAATGTYPHVGENSRQIAIERLRFPAEPLGGKARHLPASWCEWVMELLERDPQNRPASPSAAYHLLGIA
jgi:serine/threonine protein kinase